jgi:hypothetical protein
MERNIIYGVTTTNVWLCARKNREVPGKKSLLICGAGRASPRRRTLVAGKKPKWESRLSCGECFFIAENLIKKRTYDYSET